jgi:hypothetical protein
MALLVAVAEPMLLVLMLLVQTLGLAAQARHPLFLAHL